MRTMYDGIIPSRLPAGGDLYAGYVDGRWPDADAIAERFPGKPVVRIATSTGTDDGAVGDGPPDNGTWAAWVEWTVRRRAAGADPTVYTNASSWSAGIQAFKDAGVAQPHWWIAHYDGDPTIPDGAVAKQYASNDDYDTSSVADYWPGVDPEPQPPAAAAALLEEDNEMQQIEPLAVHAGEYAYAFTGQTQVGLIADGSDGPPARLRIVFWQGDKPSVLDGVQIGGSAHHSLGHKLPAGTTGMTVRREDSQSFPIGVSAK